MEKRKHQLESRAGRWYCTVCQWSWKTRKQSECPGVPRYDVDTLPPSLKPSASPSGPPDACYRRRRKPNWVWLYDEQNMIQPSIIEKIVAWFHRRPTCKMCRQVLQERDLHIYADGFCDVCRFELRWLQYRKNIEEWAQEIYQSPYAAILDTETTGLKDRAVVIELTIIPMLDHLPQMKTRIRPQQPIPPGATAVNSITDYDVRSAPTLPEIWPQLVEMFQRYHTIICYNEEFHRSRLDWTARQYGLALPPVEWRCLSNTYAIYYGKVGLDKTFIRAPLNYACEQQGITRVSYSHYHSFKHALQARALFRALAEKNVDHWED